jgi:hypothetical protein
VQLPGGRNAVPAAARLKTGQSGQIWFALDEDKGLNGRMKHRLLRLKAWLGGLVFVSFLTSAMGETKVDFWHSYVPPTGVTHYSFQIASYKRGLFFGSCGPGTRSLRWQYDIDLTGPGPVYTKEQIGMRSDLQPVDVVAGTIRVDSATHQVVIDLRLQNTNSIAFPGNGAYPFKTLK